MSNSENDTKTSRKEFKKYANAVSIIKGDIQELGAILSSGVGFDAKDIYFAIRHSNIEIIRWLYATYPTKFDNKVKFHFMYTPTMGKLDFMAGVWGKDTTYWHAAMKFAVSNDDRKLFAEVMQNFDTTIMRDMWYTEFQNAMRDIIQLNRIWIAKIFFQKLESIFPYIYLEIRNSFISNAIKMGSRELLEALSETTRNGGKFILSSIILNSGRTKMIYEVFEKTVLRKSPEQKYKFIRQCFDNAVCKTAIDILPFLCEKYRQFNCSYYEGIRGKKAKRSPPKNAVMSIVDIPVLDNIIYEFAFSKSAIELILEDNLGELKWAYESGFVTLGTYDIKMAIVKGNRDVLEWMAKSCGGKDHKLTLLGNANPVTIRYAELAGHSNKMIMHMSLTVAARSGDLNTMINIIQSNDSTEMATSIGYAIKHLIKNDDVVAITALSNLPNVNSNILQNALMQAITENKFSIVRVIIDTNRVSNILLCLSWAVTKNNVEAFDLLLYNYQQNQELTYIKKTQFVRDAVAKYSYDVLIYILDTASTSRTNLIHYALEMAINNRNINAVDKLSSVYPNIITPSMAEMAKIAILHGV